MAHHSAMTKFLAADRWCCNQHVPPKPLCQNHKSLWHGVGMVNFDVKLQSWTLASILARSALRWVDVSLTSLKPNSWSDSRTISCCLYYSPLVHWDLTFHFNALSLYDLLRNHGLIAHEPFFHRILFWPLHCTLYSQSYRYPLYPYCSLYLLHCVILILLTYSFIGLVPTMCQDPIHPYSRRTHYTAFVPYIIKIVQGAV